jgi:hypothetical protein
MRRTHALMPLTFQEGAVRDLLVEERLSFESHHVFELRPPTPQRGISVDFLVFLGNGVAIECTICGRRNGSALSELRRRSAYMNLRFGLLKATLPKLVCGGFVEAPYENQDKLATQLGLILEHADFLARSGQELREALGKLRTRSPEAGQR